MKFLNNLFLCYLYLDPLIIISLSKLLMRTGVIVSYNSVIRCGVIKDANKHKIRFYNEHPDIRLKVLDVVRFSVGFVDNALKAVNVIPVLDKNGSRVSLAMLVN
ncbi:hypothetical protein EA772_15265 [Pedobacter sp. G11]|nr:hypothetical protein EA772_15265 [Pedobacter sp. G11]